MWIKQKEKSLCSSEMNLCVLQALSWVIVSWRPSALQRHPKLKSFSEDVPFISCSSEKLFYYLTVLPRTCLGAYAEVLPVLLHYSARFPLPLCISSQTHYFHKCLKIPNYRHWVLPCLFKADGGLHQLRFGLPSWIWFFKAHCSGLPAKQLTVACLLLFF